MNQIAVFIPAHNEAQTIADVLGQIPKQISSRNVAIVVADDASTDDTAKIAQKYTPHVVTLPQNMGVGATTKVGLTYLSRLKDVEYVVKLDADGQHLPSFIERVVDELDAGADVVCCSRFHAQSDQSKAPVDRVLLNNMFSAQIRVITGWEVSDARTGFMGFHFEDIQAVAKNLIVERYGIPMEILVRLWHSKPHAQLVELPHPARYNHGISHRLDEKYRAEDHADQAQRLKDGYQSLLKVLVDLGVTTDTILARKSMHVVYNARRRASDMQSVGQSFR